MPKNLRNWKWGCWGNLVGLQMGVKVIPRTAFAVKITKNKILLYHLITW